MSHKVDVMMDCSQRLGCKLGLKLVRGAYVNTERRIARQYVRLVSYCVVEQVVHAVYQ